MMEVLVESLVDCVLQLGTKSDYAMISTGCFGCRMLPVRGKVERRGRGGQGSA